MNIIRTIRKVLLEDSHNRGTIRKIVKDITTIFKNNESGYFHLPEDVDVNGEMVYFIPELDAEFVIELTIEKDNDIDGYGVNANFLNEDESIEIKIVYDTEDKQKIMYDLIGELNEILAHELRHLHQQVRGTHKLSGRKPKNSFKYYTQPHEIDAQYHGFKRLSKLTKKPMETIVRTWFQKNQDIHNLKEKEKEVVITKILSHK